MVQPASKRLVTEAKLTTEITALNLGTAAESDAGDFLPDSYTPAVGDLPSSVMLTADYSGGTAVRPVAGPGWPTGPRVLWVCTTSAVPPVVTSGTAGRYDGDIVSVVA